MVAAVAALALVAAGVTAVVAARAAAAPRSYIVVLRDGEDAQAVAREHSARFGVQVVHVYDQALLGYAGRIPSGQLAAIRADPRVRYVEADQPVRAFGR